MPELIPNQNLSAMFGQSLGSGLSQGLARLASNKVKDIERSKKAESFQRAFNIHPDLAHTFAQLEENSPNTFYKLLEGIGGTPPGQQSQEGNQEPQYNKFIPGQRTAESKETRKQLNTFLTGFNKKYKAVDELGSLAENTLKELRAAKKDLPSFPLNLISQKYNPLASAKVRKLEADYNKIVGKVAAAEAAGSGFRSGAALTKLAAAGKSALDQPFETQEGLLEDIVKEREEARKLKNTMLDIKTKSGGNYPLDLEDRLSALDLEGQGSSSNQAQSQEQYDGDIKKDPETGQILKWDPSQSRYRIAKKRG